MIISLKSWENIKCHNFAVKRAESKRYSKMFPNYLRTYDTNRKYVNRKTVSVLKREPQILTCLNTA
jgi:hypothetical protein